MTEQLAIALVSGLFSMAFYRLVFLHGYVVMTMKEFEDAVTEISALAIVELLRKEAKKHGT